MSAHVVACRDCDLLHTLGELPEGATALCRRCGGVLRRRRRNTIERTLALSLAAAVLFAVANAFPFLSFAMKGQVTTTTLVSGVRRSLRPGEARDRRPRRNDGGRRPLVQIVLLVYVCCRSISAAFRGG